MKTKEKLIRSIANKILLWKKMCIDLMGATELSEYSSWEDIVNNDKFKAEHIITVSTIIPTFDAAEQHYLNSLPYYKAMKELVAEKALTREFFDMPEGVNLFCLTDCSSGEVNRTSGYLTFNKNKEIAKAQILEPRIASLLKSDMLFVINYNVGIVVATISFVAESKIG